MAIKDWFNFKQKPLATSADSAKKAASSGALYSEQAIDKMNRFFEDLLRIDTDEVLRNAGISRHKLSVLLSDDEIDSKVGIRAESLLQSKYTLSDGNSEVSRFIYGQIEIHREALLTACMDAKWYGYSVSEIVWDKQTKNRTGIVQPLSVVQKPLQWFEPKNDGRLLWFANDGMTGVEVNTSYKYLLMQHKPTYLEPKGKALLSRVYWLWYFKKNGWQFWSKFLERFGAPLLIGTANENPQAMANALMSAHNQSIVAINKGETVNAISATGNGEAFKAYDEAINKRIAKYLLGNTLTSGADSGGTYGQGVVHQEQQQMLLDGDKKFAERYIQRFVDMICTLNGYESPKFTFVFDKGLQPERAERDSKLYNQGVRFSESYYVDAYDFNPDYISVVEQSPARLFTHKPNKSYQFAADGGGEFTAEQQELEQVADEAQNERVQPFDTKAVLAAIKDAENVEALRETLFGMVGDGLSDSDFTLLVSAALRIADVHGFADESAEV